MPIQAADAGGDGADLFAAGGDGDVGPGQRLVVELARDVVVGIDADFVECLDDLWVGSSAGVATC